MKKKSTIILGSVVAVCALCLVLSQFVDWPVNSDDADGDIAKSAKFSRKQATEKLTNMEELLQNDSAYKDGIVAAQVVMQTRAAQFASLVKMSNEVAGNIPAFAEVLKGMNAASEMVANVNNSLMESGDDLNAALGGDECPDLTQKTINASLAYTTLQKQNKLADQFIEATDKYLASAKGDDRLKFVRDQWLDYQQVTAALEGNKENAEKLTKKGTLLTAEKSLAALASFEPSLQATVFNNTYMSQQINVPTGLSCQLPPQLIEQVVKGIQNAAGVTIQKMNADDITLKNQEIDVQAIFNTATGEAIAKAFSNVNGAFGRVFEESYKEGLNQVQRGLSQTQRGLSQNQGSLSQTQRGLSQTQRGLNQTQRGLNQTQRGLNQTQRGLNQTQRGLNQTQRGLNQTNKDAISDLAVIRLASAQNVVSAFGRVLSQQAGKEALQQSQGSLSNTIGNVIQETSIGQKATVNQKASADQ